MRSLNLMCSALLLFGLSHSAYAAHCTNKWEIKEQISDGWDHVAWAELDQDDYALMLIKVGSVIATAGGTSPLVLEAATTSLATIAGRLAIELGNSGASELISQLVQDPTSIHTVVRGDVKYEIGHKAFNHKECTLSRCRGVCLPTPNTHGVYVRWNSGEGRAHVTATVGAMLADRRAREGWEIFSLATAGDALQDGEVALHWHTGFMSCQNNGSIYSNAQKVGDWERFLLIRNDDDTISLFNPFFKRYVVAEDNGGSVMNCNRVEASEWERFHLEKAGGKKYALKTASGFYASAQP